MGMLKLRERELRMPIGFSFTARDVEAEGAQHHFGIFNTNEKSVSYTHLTLPTIVDV